MRSQSQQAVKMLVKAREDFQSMRLRMDNRIGRKADGEEQNITDGRSFQPEDYDVFTLIADNARSQEEQIAKELKLRLKRFPIWNTWLKDVKGIGEIAAGWIIGEFDIQKADTVSKLWQFTGLNPGMVRGKMAVNEKKYKPEMGQVIGSLPNAKDGSKRLCVLTSKLIRGDKLTEGFLAPFNRRLRTALCGVLADGFIKAQSNYALEYYYPYKKRLEQSSKVIDGEESTWSETSKGHRDRAAKRYMIKMFLADLYVAWRSAEGLPVREPYQEEYLGKKHQKPS